MPNFVLTIAGSTINLDNVNACIVRGKLWTRDGTPDLLIQRRGIALPGLPDPWLTKEVTLSYSGTMYFKGDMVDVEPTRDDRLGWVLNYTALGLRYRADRVPVTDDNTTTDTVAYNLASDDPNYIASRAGRTVGQIITDVLTQTTNATRLNAVGIGAYASMGPPAVLPALTIADLATAALSVIPPFPVYVSGEKILNGVAAFLSGVAPNHVLWVQPDGTIRFLDQRAFSSSTSTLTLGVDPIEPTPLRRSTRGNYSRVQLRGQPLIEPGIVSTVYGTLTEDFAHDSLSNSAAKAAWKLGDFLQTQVAADGGTCTCPSTTTVTVTSSPNTTVWPANYWDQAGSDAHGVIYLWYSAGTNIDQVTSRRIISNTSKASGGTSTLTLDSPLPITNYDHYQIFGQQSGASIVWRRYTVTAALAAAMASHFNYAVPFRNSDGSAVTLTTFPTSDIVWGGTAPYFEAPMGFTQDPVAGTITFFRPVVTLSEADQTKLIAGSGYQTPVDVRVLLAINKGALTATAPPDSGGPVYAGTLHTVEGVDRTLYVMVPAWRDPSNQTNMNAFATHFLDSVKDTVVEGAVTYHGLYLPALTPGMALSIAGAHGSTVITTGWEAIACPVAECELVWNNSGAGSTFTTQISVSNRRALFSGEIFARPAQVGITIGTSEAPAGLSGPSDAYGGSTSQGGFEGNSESSGGGSAGGFGGGFATPAAAAPSQGKESVADRNHNARMKEQERKRAANANKGPSVADVNHGAREAQDDKQRAANANKPLPADANHNARLAEEDRKRRERDKGDS
jgi:hypothetical protein